MNVIHFKRKFVSILLSTALVAVSVPVAVVPVLAEGTESQKSDTSVYDDGTTGQKSGTTVSVDGTSDNVYRVCELAESLRKENYPAGLSP